MGAFENVKFPGQASEPAPKPADSFSAVKFPESAPAAAVAKSSFASVPFPKGTQPTSTPAYFYGTSTKGAAIGKSDEVDASGKPFFAYRNPGDTSTTTDKTRVATIFDPRKPAKVTRESFYTPRAVDLRNKMKETMGIQYSDELDHMIAVALSGSNDPSNLRPIPARKNNDSPIIQKLQQEVINGKMSLFDAQTELAKEKGLNAPWIVKDDIVLPNPSFKDLARGEKQRQFDKTQASTQAVATDPEESGFVTEAVLGIGAALKRAALPFTSVVQAIKEKNLEPIKEFARILSEELPSHNRLMIINPVTGKPELDPVEAQKVIQFGTAFVGSAPQNISGKLAKNAAEEFAAQELRRGIKNAPKELPAGKGSTANVTQLNELVDNSLRKNPTGIREKSIDYYKQNPQEITNPDKPVLLREVEGKVVIEDGRHRLEAANQLGIDNVPVKDVTPEYPAIEGQPGQSSEMLKSVIKSEAVPIDRSIRNNGKFAGSNSIYKGESDLTTTILQKLEGRAAVSKQFISDLTNSPELKQVERDLIRDTLASYPDDKPIPVDAFAKKVKAELLPIERSNFGTKDGLEPRYENIALPDESRGAVANYSEHVYQSPIKTSAGNVHFGGRGSENYFGHTRVEDMADGNQEALTKLIKERGQPKGPDEAHLYAGAGGTRRIIEVQSDLYQKGRLESELERNKPGPGRYSMLGTPQEKFIPNKNKVADMAKFDRESKQLRQYNDPTAHFRMVREEIKQAAVDGKTKLQFPTGETAMKIEGLGVKDRWFQKTGTGFGAFEKVKPENLKVGMTISDDAVAYGLDDNKAQWIITDVLGDGKFKAVQAREFDTRLEGVEGLSYAEQIDYARHHKPEIFDNTETFDISGKVDTNNPIYKFYEKDLGRYLSNKFGAKRITDAQGVSWYELPITEDMASKPVTAFKAGNRNAGPKLINADVEKLIRDLAKKEGISNLTVIFDKNIFKNSGYLGSAKSFNDILTGETRNVIKLLDAKGKTSIRNGFHELKHLVDRLDKGRWELWRNEAAKKMTAKDFDLYKEYGYETKAEQIDEFMADEWGKKMADEAGYKGRLDTILDAIKDFISKIKSAAKKAWEFLRSPEAKKGFAKNPLADGASEATQLSTAEKKVVEAFDRSTGHKTVGMLNGENLVIGSFGENAIARKTAAGKPDRLPISDITKTLKYIKNEYRAGNSGFRKDNTISVAKMPDGEQRVIVTRVNKSGAAEVVNFFKIGRDADTFIENLKSFGTPDQNRTGRTSVRTGSVAPSNGDNSTLPKTDDSVKTDSVDIKIDYKEAEKGNRELNKQLKKEAPGPTAQIDNKITDLETKRSILTEKINNDPAKELLKYRGKNGLGEVTGERGGIWKSMGDEKANELGFASSEDARTAVDQHLLDKKRLTDLNEQLQEAREVRADLVKEDKDAKSLNYVLNKNAKLTEAEIARQDRLTEVKRQEQITAKRLSDEASYQASYQAKIDQAKVESEKSKGFIALIRSRLNPLKFLDDKTKTVFTNWFTKKEVAKQIAQDVFNDASIAGPQTMDEIFEYQAGKQTPYIKEGFDSMQTEFRRRGLDIDYIDDYIPQVWDNTPRQFDEAAKSYLKKKGLTDKEIEEYIAGAELPAEKSLRLKLRPNFVKERFWPDYKTGMLHGLKPQYRSPAQLMAHYRESGEAAIANRELISDLKKEAKLLPSDTAPDTWKPVTLRFSKEGLYAPPGLADLINGKFRDEAHLSIYEKAAKGISATSRLWQEIKLSAGVPFSSINYFSLGQAIKLWTTSVGEAATLKFPQALTSLKASFALIRANSNKASAKFFYDNRDTILRMARQGIDVSGNVGNYKNLYRTFKDVGLKDKIGMAFSKAFNEKTFNSFMPQISVQIFKDTYNQAIKKGMSAALAERYAADTTVAFGGLLREVGRSKTTQETLGSLFFAPRFRENLINTFVSVGKSVTTEFKNPAFGKSRALLIGMVITLVLYDLLNKKLNGNHLWENPPGREMALRVPLGGQDVLYTDFLPSFFAMPRAIATGVAAAAKGDFETALQKAGSFFSMPVKTTFEILSNKDYFGNPIVKDTDNGSTKIKKWAEYVGVAANHPYIAEVYKYMTGKKPLYQTITNMIELPAKFTTTDNEARSKFYAAQQQKKIEQARAKEPIQKVYDENQKLKDEGKIDEADAKYAALSDEEKKIYDAIKSSAKRTATLKRKPVVQAVYDKNQSLIVEGNVAEAEAIYNGLSVEDQRIYDSIKKAAKKDD